MFFFFISFCMAKIDRPLIYTTKRYLHKDMKRHFLARLFKCNNKNLPSTLKFEVNTSKKELFLTASASKVLQVTRFLVVVVVAFSLFMIRLD